MTDQGRRIEASGGDSAARADAAAAAIDMALAQLQAQARHQQMEEPAPEADQPRVVAPAPQSGPAPATATSALELLLTLEAEARRCPNESELVYLIANETRKLVGARQVFVLRLAEQKAFHVIAISSLPDVDRNTPLVRWLETRASQLVLEGLEDIALLRVTEQTGSTEEIRDFPFDHLLFCPLRLRSGAVFGVIALARETPWPDRDRIVLKRLSETYAHAWAALAGVGGLQRGFSWWRKASYAGAALAVLAMALPVPMTALAPFEVVARAPIVVAAPLDGVVASVKIEPNTPVQEGDALLVFEDTTLRSKFDVAERNVAVAAAKERKFAQAAFSDPQARREVAIASTELRLAETERDYARDLLARTTLRAPKAGLAAFGSRKEWEGRPVVTGERIMEIVDPADVAISVELSAKDAIVLKDKARIKLYLDSDPLNPLEATLLEASYHAQPTSATTLAFILRAHTEAAPKGALRLGYRGTAQVYGDETWLGFYLFRRPIAALRQLVGI